MADDRLYDPKVDTLCHTYGTIPEHIVMRADRLLSILLLLQTHPRLTARELAQRLEVSPRTIHRDMEALGAAGVPVVAERGAGGGWRLLESYRTDLTGLNGAEIQALFVTKPAHLLADLGLNQAGEAALIKLLAALPAMARRDAEFTRQRIHVDGASWHRPDEAVPLLPVLHDALWQERRLRIVYGRGADSVERALDPLGLVAKNSVWYLVAAVDGDLRTYRVSRIHHAEPLDQPSIRPPDFDLAAYWEQSLVAFKQALPRYYATLRVDPTIWERVQRPVRYGQIEQTLPPDADGWLRVVMRFDVEEVAREFVLGYGAQIEVIDPPALRAQIIEHAQQILQRYTTSGAPALVQATHAG
jgi:predicted DNA-binding transcriptional regulator YafY